MEEKKKKFNRTIIRLPNILEKLVAAILLVGIVYGGYRLIIDAFAFISPDTEALAYMETLLVSAFSVIIVIEFVRMLVKHSMNTIIEVLIFAIARGIVAGHEESLSMLVRVLAIALLLFCRKYLFKEFDFEEEE
ncbi:hypothetical protein SAMN05421493_10666 [Pseudobutyrivibrio sp. 49]|uniref:hypothetical protein n=1 Tax=unclassified Pseudobutyrivibrio TaxID=2638619 RepID=UPI000882189A|nr:MULTISPECIES: hypothetical protein [unclassified Pseudobutyrivibrio]SDH97343.1 hypothetical protein SAMN05421493_10666 [Pseudobutyrivibrio sp. 49]SFN87377.1 hypothetical protein SAMN04487831_104177 [Pseudobutyrivibrio sp. UC1225]